MKLALAGASLAIRVATGFITGNPYEYQIPRAPNADAALGTTTPP